MVASVNHHIFTRFCLILALLAVFTRALIPAGYMPSLHSGDVFKMVICTTEGSQTIDVDDHFNPLNDRAPPKKAAPCDFSLVKNLSLQLPALAIFSVLLLLSFLNFGVPQDHIRRPTPRYILLQPRAPPLSI